jgi:hypothetical protein
MQRSQQENGLPGEQYPYNPQGQGQQERHPLLRRHLIVSSLCLIGAALLLIMTSFSADSIFPVFALLGVSLAFPCLLIGIVLGISGSVTGIVGILEHLDHPGCVDYLSAQSTFRIASTQCRAHVSDLARNASAPAANFKEHRYDRN